MYLDLEIQLLKQIQELKKRTNFIAIKSEYEAEGSDNAEIQYVQSLSKKLRIKHFVKIGGVEAKNDIYNWIKFGVDGIIAPMVESRFGMKKFISAIKDFKTSKKPYLAINIETKNAIENIIDILNEAKGNINGAKKSVEASGTNHSTDPESISWTTKETVRTTSFWLIVAAEFLIILTSGTIGFQIVPFLSDSGYSLKIAAAVWSISSLLNAFSNPLWGFLSDKYSPRILVLYALCTCIAVTTTFLIFDPHQAGIISSILWGASSGGLTILGGMLIARYFGRKSFGTISGITGPFQTCGLGLGPILGAILYNTTEEYTILFVSAICFYLIAATLFLFAKRPTRINAL